MTTRALIQRAQRNPMRKTDSVAAAHRELNSYRERRRKDKLRELNYQLSAYRGGQIDRMHPKRGSVSDADTDILEELPALREKSRDLVKNSTIAAGIIKAMVDNVIGRGIKPQSRPRSDRLGVSETLVKEFTERAEDGWEAWAEEEWPDATERLSYYEMQRLDFETTLVSGEGILQRLSLKLGPENRPLSLAFNSIEPDQMATPPRSKDIDIRGGVELGPRGQPIAYHFMKRHPGRFGVLTADDFIRIRRWSDLGRKNIIHTYNMSRPGQSRGVPLLAPSMTAIEDAGYLDETTLTMQRVRTLMSTWIETPDPHGMATKQAAESIDTDLIEDMDFAVIRYLGPGQTVKGIDPKPAGTEYDAIQRRFDRCISSAVGLPYEIVRKDFSQSNFSNTRAALLDVYNTFRIMQSMQIRRRDRVVWRLFLREMVERDFLPIGRDEFEAHLNEWCRVRWETPGWNWLDPLKEVQAAAAGIQLGVNTRADICAQQGKDWQETGEQLAKEKAFAEEQGLVTEPAKEPADDPDEERDQGNEGDADTAEGEEEVSSDGSDQAQT